MRPKFKLMILSEGKQVELKTRNTQGQMQKKLSNDWSFNVILLNLANNKDIEPLMSFDVMHGKAKSRT
jgi:hypothetical protein